MKRLIFTIIILTILFLSCKKSDNAQTSDSDLIVGEYKGANGVKPILDVSKVDNKTISLHFVDASDPNSTWNHTFTATVTGSTFSFKDQYWPFAKLSVTAGGQLIGDILTIDYKFSDGTTEDGLIYNRIKK